MPVQDEAFFVDLVPRLCLGTQGPEALPRDVAITSATGRRGQFMCNHFLPIAPNAEAEPPVSAFPGRAWERALRYDFA
jgi:hypothetical protein